eukprot:m.1331337 g.1331337  ORF g.1331337 m.1331337 type:complete len:461 (-) comp24863_c1_seq1:3265-4647(-)
MLTKMLNSIMGATLLAAVTGTQLRYMYETPGDAHNYAFGLVDAATGKIQAAGAVILPPTNCTPGWRLSNGTTQQSSTTFYMNGSWFFLGHEMCGEVVEHTSLFSVIGPFPDANGAVAPLEVTGAYPARVVKIDDLETYGNTPIDTWNLAWDWTCNIVVIAPHRSKAVQDAGEVSAESSIVFKTLQISYYDSAIRPQADLTEELEDCKNCWRKVSGTAGLDARGMQEQDLHTRELNCGDECTLYVVEQFFNADGKPHFPRRIIGRSFRTGKVLSNVTDIVNTVSLTYADIYTYYNAKQHDFIGLGMCSDASWEDKKCKGNAGKMTLIAYKGRDSAPYVIETLDITVPAKGVDAAGRRMYNVRDSADATTAARLGVSVIKASPFDPEKTTTVARILIDRKIVSYVLNYNTEGDLSGRVNTTSAALPHVPYMWTLSRFDMRAERLEAAHAARKDVLKQYAMEE